MHKKMLIIGRRGKFLVAALAVAILAAGCTNTKVADVIKRTHAVITDCQDALQETLDMVSGSELETKLKPHIDKVMEALGVVENTLERVAALLGADLSAAEVEDLRAALERLGDSQQQLQDAVDALPDDS